MSEGKIKVYGRRLSNREIADLLQLSPESQCERDRMKTIADEQCRVSSVCRELREQCDRLAVALDVCLREMLDVIYACNEEIVDANDTFHQAIKLGQKTLAAVEGGSDEPVNLIHNGVGIADMYSRDEFENAMKLTNQTIVSDEAAKPNTKNLS